MIYVRLPMKPIRNDLCTVTHESCWDGGEEELLTPHRDAGLRVLHLPQDILQLQHGRGHTHGRCQAHYCYYPYHCGHCTFYSHDTVMLILLSEESALLPQKCFSYEENVTTLNLHCGTK